MHRGAKQQEFRADALAWEMLYSRDVRQPRKSRKRRLGIVPRALLGAAIAGSVPAAIVPACSSDSGSIDGPQFAVDAFVPDRPEFRVDAPIQPDAEFVVDAALPSDGPEFAVDAPTDA